jgi:hypothetical protein
MPFTMEDYANIQSSEAKFRRFVDETVEELVHRPHVTVDLLKRVPKKQVNSLMRQFPLHLYDNPNVGRSTSREEFRSPGSPAFGAFYFGPVGAHITGGLDGDTLDNEKASGMRSQDVVAMRMSRDMEVFWNDLNAGLFHGNTGERAVVDTSVAISYDGTYSTITFDTEWGVKHLNPGGIYEFYNGTDHVGAANGSKCVDKDPSGRTARFEGDLTAATLGGEAIVDGSIAVNYGCWNRDLDGFPEFFADTGWYGGLKKDDLYQTQGLQVDADDKNLSIGLLEKCDTIHMYACGTEYRPGSRVDICSPTQEQAINEIGWAQRVYDSTTADLGFTSVKYKGRTRVIDRDCSPFEWLQVDLSTLCHLMLHEFGVMPGTRDANTFQRISPTTGVAMDMYYWIFYGKGQRACRNPRKNLLMHSLGTEGLEMGDVF